MKLNFKGRKLQVRIMADDETIQEGDLYSLTCASFGELDPVMWNRFQYGITACAGEKVSEHKGRIYLRVESKFWNKGK